MARIRDSTTDYFVFVQCLPPSTAYSRKSGKGEGVGRKSLVLSVRRRFVSLYCDYLLSA